MALGRRKPRVRREPTFVAPVAKLDLRLTSEDRPAADQNQSEPAFRKAGADAKQSTRPKARPRRARRQAAKESGPRKGAGGGRGGRKQRSSLGRFLYWACVLALWLVIGLIASVVWVGAHLPAIHRSKFPSARPRSRSSPATARCSRRAVTAASRSRCANCPRMCRKPSSRSKTGASTVITASIRLASAARWSPTRCIAA